LIGRETMTPFEMVESFHETFDNRKPKEPTPFSAEDASFRAGFKVEELVEFLYAACENDEESFKESIKKLHHSIDQAYHKVENKHRFVSDPLVDQVDALSDLLYFTYGSFSLVGVDPQPILEIVHQANMKKLFPDGKPHYDPVTNKVMKPKNWEQEAAPEKKIKSELVRQRREK